MLTTLRIKNLALVNDLTLEFGPGYNAITGETGAGKSVIIGALKLVLGERADRGLIRSGAEGCSVEAAFTMDAIEPRIKTFLDEHGLDPAEDSQLLLRRTFSASGANRQFINGSPAPLAVLARLGEWLVDMHGPHDHQSLLDPARQREILDAYGELHSIKEALAGLCRTRAEILRQKAELIVDERTYAQQIDLLRFQSHEIAAARLEADEESALETEYARASNAARLTELSQGALAAISEDDNALLTLAGVAGRSLQELARLDPGASGLLETHEQAVSTLQDLQRELSRYADHIEVDPVRLKELEARLDLLQSLKRKYGASLAEVIAFGEEAARKLHALESRDAELEQLQAQQRQTENAIWKAAGELTAARRKIIPRLAKAAAKELNDLGFRQSFLEIRLESKTRGAWFEGAVSENGPDTVEFLFAPNPGEPPRPLRAIASSGELARVMLALKTVLARQDEIPLLVFDEVDANVGGETAAAVGAKMRQIGEQRQVLCITHLAQVAAAGRSHFVVSKEVLDGRSVSLVSPVQGKQRVAEITRMLGGGDAARRHAEALLVEAGSAAR